MLQTFMLGVGLIAIWVILLAHDIDNDFSDAIGGTGLFLCGIVAIVRIALLFVIR